MTHSGIEGSQACPKGLRHDFDIAAVAADGPLPTIAVYTLAAGLEARDFLAMMWERKGEFGRIQRLKASEEGP